MTEYLQAEHLQAELLRTESTEPVGPSRFLRRFCVVLMILGGLLGWVIPDIYDWSGSDQSRPSPLIGPVASGILVSLLALMAIFLRIHFTNRWRSASYGPSRLTIRQIMVVTLIAATVLALGKQMSVAFSFAFFSLVLGYFIYMGWKVPGIRWQLATLLVCQYAPFLWIIRNINKWNGPDALLGLVALPTLFPSALLSGLMKQNMQGAPWIGLILTSLELALGVWLARQGEKRMIAFTAVVLVIALFSSFGLNALVRA